jgi:hypothetical protein
VGVDDDVLVFLGFAEDFLEDGAAEDSHPGWPTPKRSR